MSLRWSGIPEFQRDLSDVARRARRPTLTESGRRILEVLQRNIESSGRLGAWPPLAPATVANRLRLGFPASPPLIRTGSLLAEVSVLSESDSSVEVGVDDSGRASVLDATRPFIGFLPEDVDPIVEPVIDYVFGRS